jgi:hypothetical protein
MCSVLDSGLLRASEPKFSGCKATGVYHRKLAQEGFFGTMVSGLTVASVVALREA